MLYYASRISENISRREPEGYLICVNVPIARSGTQQYLQDELGMDGDKRITVFRPEEEVFSEATIASFEGMPVTNDHPDAEEGVTIDNFQYLNKGHAQNVHRGTGNESDLLIADLIITDPQMIHEIIDNGKREISCGYNYELCEEDGKYIQRQICGNHIAIVDRGRAGHRVCIKDSAPKSERRKTKMAKRNHSGILAKMLAALVAHDAEPEEIEEAVDAIEDITSGEEKPVEVEETEKVETDADPDMLADIVARLEKLEAAMGAKDEDPEEEPDPLKELEDELGEDPEEMPEEEEEMVPDEDPEEEESHFVDPEEINEQDEGLEETPVVEETTDKKACDAMREAIKTLRPIIAKLPEKERRKASDAMAKQLRKSMGMTDKASRNDYLRLKARKKASDSQKVDPSELGRNIMANRNPNYKK